MTSGTPTLSCILALIICHNYLEGLHKSLSSNSEFVYCLYEILISLLILLYCWFCSLAFLACRSNRLFLAIFFLNGWSYQGRSCLPHAVLLGTTLIKMFDISIVNYCQFSLAVCPEQLEKTPLFSAKISCNIQVSQMQAPIAAC